MIIRGYNLKEHLWIQSRGKNISAMLHNGEDKVKSKNLIIICHGFTGEKIGGSKFYINMANALEKIGYSVLRFDFVGSGESEGDFSEETYISGWLQDLKMVVKKIYVLKKYSSIYLLGHSLGGYITLLYKDDYYNIDGRIAIAPEINPLENYQMNILGQNYWKQLSENRTITGFFGKNLRLKPKFYIDMTRNHYDNKKIQASCEGPLQLIHGDLDQAVSKEFSLSFFNVYQYEKYIDIIKNADHGFKDKERFSVK